MPDKNWNLAIEPRPYQNEAAERALARRQAVCSLPSGLRLSGAATAEYQAVLWRDILN